MLFQSFADRDVDNIDVEGHRFAEKVIIPTAIKRFQIDEKEQ